LFQRLSKVIVLLNCIIATVVCCTNNNQQKPVMRESAGDSTKRVIKEYYKNHYSSLANQLHLPNINEGNQGLEIRIWASSMLIPADVVRIFVSDSVQSYKNYSYTVIDNSTISYTVTAISNDTIAELGKLLDTLDFSSYISQEDIPEFEDLVADGMTYTMEIRKGGHYKILIYHCPDYFAKKEFNNRKFLALLKLIHQYIAIYRPFCGALE
jgi:hypothetical protein